MPAAGVDHHTQEPAQGLRDRIVARAFDIGTAPAEAADGRVDQPRIEGGELFASGTEARRGAGPEILDEHIGLAHQALEQAALFRFLEIQGKTAFVAVVGLKMRRIAVALIAPIGIALGALHFDDIGTEVGEHHARAGAGDERALLHHTDAVQDSAQLQCWLTHGWARNPPAPFRRNRWPTPPRETARNQWGAPVPPGDER